MFSAAFLTIAIPKFFFFLISNIFCGKLPKGDSILQASLKKHIGAVVEISQYKKQNHESYFTVLRFKNEKVEFYDEIEEKFEPGIFKIKTEDEGNKLVAVSDEELCELEIQ